MSDDTNIKTLFCGRNFVTIICFVEEMGNTPKTPAAFLARKGGPSVDQLSSYVL
ncbi:hypothetical protein RGU12_22140 [Fredinandcohnia sp. QZ13]|uniref:hypothetical protein n=1 Tax=Fredinandcohnia sp. QZ13 TaxID=3073144 RepID=UPI0028533F6A|nr:hypothetical protein [Fredinandcohnia sp. QZ13]MDR4890204.1 hypothetical protein [Fredinandcohnia sp. QZ13]